MNMQAMHDDAEPPTRNAIQIRVDDKSMTVAPGSTLHSLVQSLGHDANRVTTAVNGHFVPRPARASAQLHEGDSVVLFQPIVGG